MATHTAETFVDAPAKKEWEHLADCGGAWQYDPTEIKPHSSAPRRPYGEDHGAQP